ncbi:hypothetical protein CW713_11980 [Methanophagales archaeon]|nr:MAG: hypothetical protein CW713_11980 [Methanophagales archaeon]
MRARIRKNTRFVITLFSAVLLLLLLVMASASAAEGPAVMIANYTVEPKVLMPGDTGTITITIENMDTQSSETKIETSQDLLTKTTTASTISAEIDCIRLSSGTRDIEWRSEGSKRSEYYNVGALGPGKSMTIPIPIKTASYAHDGTYTLEVYIEVDNGKNVRHPVHVKIDSSSVEILEKDIPSEISLSESKQIAIVVANNRPNSVRGVDVCVKSEGKGLEFTPERIFVGDLEAYGKKEVNFTLQTQTFKESLMGNREFSFEVAYKNGDNVHHNELKSSVLVKSIADVRLILVNAPEFVFEGDIARIDFDVANGMVKDIKAVSVVPAIEGLRILPSEYFIGDMEVGDVFSASFDVYTRDLGIGDTTIPFTVVFKDVDTDKQYEMQGYEVHVEVRKPQQSELPNQMLFGTLLVILVLVVLAVWVRVKRKRKVE